MLFYKNKQYTKNINDKIYNKNKGYLLLDNIVSIFIFSILVFVILSFIKRIAIIENVKKSTQEKEEKNIFVLDKIVVDIGNRDIGVDIKVEKYRLIFKKENIFYKIELKDDILYISDGQTLDKMGKNTKIGKFNNFNFEKIDRLLIINFFENDKKIIRIISL